MLKKKILSSLFFVFLCGFCFGQSYEEIFEQAVNYEYEGKWFFAYASFYDAMEKFPSSDSIEAFNEFKKIDAAFRSGKPGLVQVSQKKLEAAWIKLACEFEEYWTSHCPKVFIVSDLQRTGLNFFNKTADFSVVIDYEDSPKYKELSSSVYEGFHSAYSSSWKNISSSWPLISVHSVSSDDYFVQGSALVDIGGSVSPASLISWHDVPNGSVNSFFDVKFNLTDLEGNIIYKGGRNIAGYKSIITLQDLPQSYMRLIETGNIKIEPTGLFLEYGKVNKYDSLKRDWILDLPELNLSNSDYGFYHSSEYESQVLNKESPVSVVERLSLDLLFKDYVSYHKVNGISFEMVSLPSLKFIMGSENGNKDERPLHEVDLSSFEIGRTEVTQALYKKIMGENPSGFSSSGSTGGVNLPVDSVSWFDAIYFCNLLSMAEGYEPCYVVEGSKNPSEWNYEIHSGDFIEADVLWDFSANGYRLPTEAEWECSAKGGIFLNDASASILSNPENYAWFNENSLNTTHPVALKKMNACGLYDIGGNVWEWCWDWYHDDYADYIKIGTREDAVVLNPTGKSYGTDRVLRGGGYGSSDSGVTPTYRGLSDPKARHDFNGFRICRTIFENSVLSDSEVPDEEN